MKRRKRRAPLSTISGCTTWTCPQQKFLASRLDEFLAPRLASHHYWGRRCVMETAYENNRPFFPVLPVVAGLRITPSSRQFSFGVSRRSTGHYLHSPGEDQCGGNGASARRD